MMQDNFDPANVGGFYQHEDGRLFMYIGRIEGRECFKELERTVQIRREPSQWIPNTTKLKSITLEVK